MIKNKYIFRLFIALVFILFFVNVLQIICNRRLIDGLEQLCGINKSYASYINKSFSQIRVDENIISHVKNLGTLYAVNMQDVYVAYISPNVCRSCLSSLYTSLKDIEKETSDVLFISGIKDIQLKREAQSFGFKNFLFDEESIFSTIHMADVLFFKYDPVLEKVDCIRYDDKSFPILKLFVD